MFAVREKLDAFILDVTRTWQLPANLLNTFRNARRQTVLDFIEDELAGSVMTPAWEATLLRYYQWLRAAGALHRAEIDGLDCRWRYLPPREQRETGRADSDPAGNWLFSDGGCPRRNYRGLPNGGR